MSALPRTRFAHVPYASTSVLRGSLVSSLSSLSGAVPMARRSPLLRPPSATFSAATASHLSKEATRGRYRVRGRNDGPNLLRVLPPVPPSHLIAQAHSSVGSHVGSMSRFSTSSRFPASSRHDPRVESERRQSSPIGSSRHDQQQPSDSPMQQDATTPISSSTPSSAPSSSSSSCPSSSTKSPPTMSNPMMQKLFYNYPPALRELALQSLDRKMMAQQGRLSSSSPAGKKRGANHPRATASDYPPAPPSDEARQPLPGPDDQDRLPHHEYDPNVEQDPHQGPHPGDPSYPQYWHRPTKEELLRYARGFWQRLQIRFKWFTIRSFRRFNADDLSAFFTLGTAGTIVLFVVGTTTFMSVIFAGAKLLNLDHWIARKLTEHLTAETGVSVVFESAIVPKWREGRISFKNVFISRRSSYDPETLRQERLEVLAGHRRVRVFAEEDDMLRRAHAPMSEAPTHDTGAVDMPPQDVYESDQKDDHGGHAWDGMYYEDQEMALPMSARARGLEARERLNNNFTMFDLSVDSIDVQLDFGQWWDGKGILRSAVVRGVRGTIDRRQVSWDPNRVYDPKAARRKPKRGDFELERLDVEDVLLTIYQPKQFRPFNMSVFSASLPRFRKQWIFYDILSANSITGQFDGCLFSLHTPQSVGKSVEKERLQNQQSQWDKVSRIRIDGVNFDHIQSQSTQATGPIAWILSGRFDVVADLRFPRDLTEDMDINAIFSEIASNLSELVGRDRDQYAHRTSADALPEGAPPRSTGGFVAGQHDLNEPAIEVPVTAVGASAELAKRKAEESQVALSSEANAQRERALGPWEKQVRNALRQLKGRIQSGEIWSDALSLLSEDGRQAVLGVITDDIPTDPGALSQRNATGAAAGADGEKTMESTTAVTTSATTASDDATPVTPAQTPATAAPSPTTDDSSGDAVVQASVLERPSPTVVIDMDVRFKDIKAAVPLFTNGLSYKNHAFVRPIVAFMNANRTLIPIHARIVMDLSEFDGSMDLAQTGLMPIMYDKVYQALAAHVMSQNANLERYRNVSFWTLQLFADSSLQLLRHLRDVFTRRGILPAQLEPAPGLV